MIKAVLFDFDGVIADTYDLVVEEVLILAKEKGYSLTEEEIRNMTSKDIIEKLKIPKRKIPGFHRKGKKIVWERREEIESYSGMPELIRTFPQKYFIGLVSSGEKKLIDYFLMKHGLDMFEKKVTGVSLYGKSKRIKKLIGRLKLNPDEVVYVGDETRDIEACREAGIRIIAVSWGYNKRELLKDADFIVDKPEDILRIADEIK